MPERRFRPGRALKPSAQSPIMTARYLEADIDRLVLILAA